MEEFYILNSIQKKISRNQKGDQILDVGMQKQKQFWNRDAKRSPKTATPHIHFTYWPYQIGLYCSPYIMCSAEPSVHFST